MLEKPSFFTTVEKNKHENKVMSIRLSKKILLD